MGQEGGSTYSMRESDFRRVHVCNKEKQTKANTRANKLRLIALLDLFHFQAGHRIAFLKGIY